MQQHRQGKAKSTGLCHRRWTPSLQTHHADTTDLAPFNDFLLLVGFHGQLAPLMPLPELT
jgi:hypothetical protein